jgi:sulfur-oxidizing protein SoxX
MTKRTKTAAALLAGAMAAGTLLLGNHGMAQQAKVDPAVTKRAMDAIFAKAPEAWRAKIVQDETQKACSEHNNQPPPAVATQILEREKKNVVLPADGKFLGDWKRGEALAQSGYGGRHTDDPKRTMGGNCYACHQLSKTEVSYGTMGPSLTEYGKARRYREAAAKDAYIKIYNAQAVFPCSNMPRLGHSKHLTEQQIKDIVALLFDPESPVNK